MKSCRTSISREEADARSGSWMSKLFSDRISPSHESRPRSSAPSVPGPKKTDFDSALRSSWRGTWQIDHLDHPADQPITTPRTTASASTTMRRAWPHEVVRAWAGASALTP